MALRPRTALVSAAAPRVTPARKDAGLCAAILAYAALGVATLVVAAPVAAARAAETCDFAGTTSHDGRVVARSVVTRTPDATVVDVTLDLRATVWWVISVHYLVEEISTWRGGELAEVATNVRSLADGRIVRQGWDVFTRGPGGLEARRVQAKTLTELRRTHPAFATHWAPATFGQPWRQDYDAAAPERRPDLDLPPAQRPPGLRTPLAMAFYWTRTLPQGQTATVFLPGFKRDLTLAVDLTSNAGPPGPDAPAPPWQLWRTTLRHPALNASNPSDAEAWVSPDHLLLQLGFDLHAHAGSARGVVRATGCQGSPA